MVILNKLLIFIIREFSLENFCENLNIKHIFFYSVLIEGVKYYSDKPNMIGKTFLRLERDFDKHVTYCRDEPNAQEFIATNDEVREFFEVGHFEFRLFVEKKISLS